MLLLQVRCRVVRDFAGFDVLVRCFRDASAADHVVECTCPQSRARVPFMELFHEFVTALAAEGLTSAPAPRRARRPLKSPSSATAPAPACELSAGTLASLHAMVQSPCASVRREGLKTLARALCSRGAPALISAHVAGTPRVLRDVLPNVAGDCEARANCESVLSAFVQLGLPVH